mmetsp:Transcript_20657/g.36690  ORF Transcript_20657/g.36690 Transcript_20657/m.36690 type:complete len:258 (+) Transcript_20657:35-808(+)|eukprot:CAMPEP_0197515526 /NCGR_PEP_ID=MMETSP1318-20131121/634_1 /TAXON_ID=552666 /ORGANISM="Partenskyella glossopodia, Strain RCC365" /LENGTH=257 /DNA_ID=CAMNT_0043063923 /DNA_START=18 /DNA_END=791 /DNA_ORIENTATION=+
MRPTAADRCAVGASALLGAICALCVITYSGSSEGALGSALGTRSMAGVSAPLRGSSWVTNAISKEKKKKTVADLKERMEKSSLVFGMKFQGLKVNQIEEIRRKLPEDASIRVALNTLMRKAGEETEGFNGIGPACKGDNAWWFVGENIAQGVKAYIAFEEELKKAQKADPNVVVPELSGGCMDNEFLDANAIKALKNLPTRTEVIAKIAGSIKAVPTKLARSLKQVPQKMAVGVGKLADGDDNKDLIVGDVFPKQEA